MKIEVDTVKGFADYLPPESLKREAVRKVIEKNFKLYGFQPIETPVIEFDELMKPEAVTGEPEDEAVSDRFRLKDRAGRNLGLRYEFTFQLARIMKQNPNIKLPFRRYQIGPVFRDEPIGAGRFRQFIQCDVDILGDSGMDADADILFLVSDIMKELKIDSEILVNNRKLLTALIESVQIQNKEGVMRELDKLYKIGEDMVKTNLKKFGDSNQVITIFKLLEKPLEFFVENKFDGAEELADLIKRCSKQGLKIKFSPTMIRGLSYYTGNIFEVKQAGKSIIAGGGRYDKSVGKYLNREIPTVGISFGLDRISDIALIRAETTKCLIISINQDNNAQKLAKKLRKEGIACIVSNDKIGKAMEYANALAIPKVIFLGADEVEKEKYKLKDMQSGEEKLIGEKFLIKLLK